MSQGRFVHLHLHSEYSLLDGACRFKPLFQRVKELGMDAVALTDHGNLFGAYDFYKEAKAAEVKPLIGCELYMAPGSRFEKKGAEQQSNHHCLLLAENVEGYYSLVKLSSLAYDEGFYYKPRIDFELLAQHAKGLVGFSACLAGPIPERLLEGDEAGALRHVDTFTQILGQGNFYLELMDHGMPEQKKVNEGLLRLARKTGLPLVATNDCHYLRREDAEIHEVLLCISTQKTLSDPDRLRFGNGQIYLKSPEEMIQMFGHVDGAIDNTLALAERLHASIPTDQKLYPAFVPPEGKTVQQYLRELTEAGLKKRFPESLPDDEVYRKRLEYELATIEKTGFSSYYLVVWDFIHYAKERGIPVGPGRGSGAASLAAFALGVTDLDPIRHNLVFERFLNPERVDPPDFDIDFCFERRGQVIEYVKKKYGDKNVAQIITFGTLKARNAARDVGRVLGMTPQEVDRVAKLIPETLGITLDSALEQSSELRSQYDSQPRIRQLIDYARRLEGTVRHSSTHAAGVVIADQDLSDLVPTYRASGPGGRQELATQYAMKQVTGLGLLKMDFLGLKNLTIIDRCLRSVKEIHGVEIDWDQIPDNDPPTYAMLQDGKAFGVFQLESSGMRDLLRRLKPETFAEITALIALYRPGPMQNIGEFIDRKFGKIPVAYDHPSLEPILKETYG
ncbi:MAG: DNA polymerase III subunit alpha, partial [Candidatus Sumerlaeota bacterium]|nr:DNA polymerase III subunit alpha [Candidatus Sumerlaeota bacterium]